MNLEGKILGYNKKILALAGVLIIVSGIMFYGGAMYEKRKLTSLKAVKITTGVPNKPKKQNGAVSKNGVDPSGNKSTDVNASQNQDTATSGASGDTPSSDNSQN